MEDLRERLGDADRWVLQRLCQSGNAWIVGGWVRDSISNLNPTEIDIATNLKPHEISELFSRTIPVGEHFGTVIVLPDEGLFADNEKNLSWEVTTLRSDGKYIDGRRPEEVTFGTDILEDLARRDFTINAMAVDAKTSELIDIFGGQEDLSIGVVRAVGEAHERLNEDGLRIMRAFRFLDAGIMGLRHLDESLSQAITVNLGMLEKVSAERKWNELSQIFKGKNSHSTLQIMSEHGVLKEILSGFELNIDSDFSHQPAVDLAIICSNDKRSGLELAMSLKNSLRLSNDEAKRIEFLHNVELIDLADDSPATLRRFNISLSKSMQDDLQAYFGVEGDDYISKAAAISEPLAGRKPLINGKQLIKETNLEPDRRLGRLKGWLHRRQIEDDLESADEVLALLKTIEWETENPENWPALSWP